MHAVLTLLPGRDFRLPPGTILLRCDALLLERPGPGGIAIVRNEHARADTRVRTLGLPDSTTEDTHRQAIRLISQEIGRNRAILVTRTRTLEDALRDAYSELRLICILPASPFLAADATRNALLAAAAARHCGQEVNDIRDIAIHQRDDLTPTTAGAALVQALADIVATPAPDPEAYARASQRLIEAAAELDQLRARAAIADAAHRLSPRGTP